MFRIRQLLMPPLMYNILCFRQHPNDGSAGPGVQAPLLADCVRPGPWRSPSARQTRGEWLAVIINHASALPLHASPTGSLHLNPCLSSRRHTFFYFEAGRMSCIPLKLGKVWPLSERSLFLHVLSGPQSSKWFCLNGMRMLNAVIILTLSIKFLHIRS
jgi:hypothetical protein